MTPEQKTLILKLYPEADGGCFYPSDYDPLIHSFGEVLIKVDDGDYQGDSRVLLSKDGRFGILIFGWGSCSGCDALQACSGISDINDLRERLLASIRWGTKDETLQHLQTHDWEGDFSNSEETRRFVLESIAFLVKAE